MIRLFVAIDLPEEVIERLGWLEGGLPGARWVEPDNLHLTLRFIGPVDGGAYRDIAAALSEVRGEPFELTLRGLGHFPPRGQPKVLWVGVAEEPALVALQRAVETRLQRLGLEPEHRKFKPHVTLARLNGTPPARLARLLAAHSLFACEPFEVTELQLYSSLLHQDGAQHTVEATYPLTVR